MFIALLFAVSFTVYGVAGKSSLKVAHPSVFYVWFISIVCQKGCWNLAYLTPWILIIADTNFQTYLVLIKRLYYDAVTVRPDCLAYMILIVV